MLNVLKDNKGARYKYKRLGRGIGSGKGKTSARGGKGQTARSGVALNGFEGGQTSLYQRLPKRGFNNVNRISYEVLNLQDINNLVEDGKVSADSITLEALREIGALKGKDALLKILGTGELKHKVQLTAHAASQSAKDALAKNGSTLHLPVSVKE